MVKRRNNTLAKKGGKCGCGLIGGSYYKYNDLRNATPRDFLLSERMPAKTANHMNFPPLTVGGKRRSKRQTFKRRTKRRTKRRVKKRVSRKVKRKSSRKQRKSRKQKGGFGGKDTIIPQDIVNMGRSGSHSVSSFANSFRGIAETASPLPTEDQLDNTYNFVYKPVNISGIRAAAEDKVSKL